MSVEPKALVDDRERSADPRWQRSPFELLREKWHMVPTGLMTRSSTTDLLQWSDEALLDMWRKSLHEYTTGADGFATRGWYHELYRDFFKEKNVMDIGSGLGFDTVTFAAEGARVTFVDIVESNLQLLRRICSLQGITNVRFHFMPDVESLSSLPTDFDVVTCIGSLLHTPFDIIATEIQEILRHLPIGGRWIELAYPKIRWEREGCQPFDQWGKNTDGPDTPWAEWYDLEKRLRGLEPAKFDVVLCQNFHDDDYIWFDLLRRA
jgi:SAM-dependent methyltransferase